MKTPCHYNTGKGKEAIEECRIILILREDLDQGKEGRPFSHDGESRGIERIARGRAFMLYRK